MAYYSIIIPTNNRAQTLKAALENLMALIPATKQHEIIVIDNASTDNTAEICAQYPLVRYIYEQRAGLLFGRHRGAMEAQGEVLCYLDDDSFVDKEWLLGVEEGFSKDEVQIATGPTLPFFEVEPPSWLERFWTHNKYGKTLDKLSLIDFGDKEQWIHPLFIFGCNFIIRKQALYEFGGFHPDGVPQSMLRFRGDGESGLALHMFHYNIHALYHPKIKIHHLVSKGRMSKEYFNKRAFAEGVSLSYTHLRHGQNHLAKIYAYIKKPIKKFLSFFGFRRDGISCEVYKDIKKSYQEHCKQGYEFHQLEVKKNPKLLQYIKLQNYFDLESLEALMLDIQAKSDHNTPR